MVFGCTVIGFGIGILLTSYLGTKNKDSEDK